MNKTQFTLSPWVRRTFFGAMIWLLSSSSFAGLSPKPSDFMPLKPYEARYVVSWHGIRGGESHHRFVQRKDGLYHLETETTPFLKFLPFSYVERSDFKWENGKVVPKLYYYNIQEGRRHKQGNVFFDWRKNLVFNHISDEPWEQPIPKDVQDKLTNAVQLRVDLLKGKPEDITYTVAEDDEIKPYEFKVLGTEMLRTNIGVVKAQKVELHTGNSTRKTVMWLSISHDYLPVKVEHYRDGAVVGGGEIKSYKPSTDPEAA